MPKPDQISDTWAPLEPSSLPALTPEANDFVRDHELQADLRRYYHILERNFPQARRISFQVSDDPEIEGLRYLAATVTIRGVGEDTILQCHDRYVHEFCDTVTHDNQPYFVLDLDVDR
jgi:hypothetical protein